VEDQVESSVIKLLIFIALITHINESKPGLALATALPIPSEAPVMKRIWSLAREVGFEG